MTGDENLSVRNEWIRKLIHIACAAFPLLYFFLLTKEQIATLLGIICICFVGAEWIRFRTRSGEKWFKRIFGPLLRDEEKQHKLTGATHLFLSATVTILVFPERAAVAAVLLLTVSDSLAALAGRTFGRHRLFNKTWEGSAAFVLSGILCILWLFPLHPGFVILTVCIAALVEAAPLPLNDNWSIPLIAGGILSVMMIVNPEGMKYA